MNSLMSLTWLNLRVFFFTGLTGFLACSQNFQESGSQYKKKSIKTTQIAVAGGIQWIAPTRWEPGSPRPMRAATYKIPAEKGDSEQGECAVFYFGPGQGGTVNANLQRWFSQFEQPDGRPSSEVAIVENLKINGFSVSTVDLSGTYLFSPAPMSPRKEQKPNFRMLGAIIEGPKGPLFFKLTGPAKTVARGEPEFLELLKTLGRP